MNDYPVSNTLPFYPVPTNYQLGWLVGQNLKCKKDFEGFKAGNEYKLGVTGEYVKQEYTKNTISGQSVLNYEKQTVFPVIENGFSHGFESLEEISKFFEIPSIPYLEEVVDFPSRLVEVSKLGLKQTKIPFNFQADLSTRATFKDRLILGAEMGLGKAQDLDSKILTPTGYKRMGDIKVGDEVINSDGKISKVRGVFPQGKKKIYEVTFSDNSSTHCCDEHLWNVKTALNKWKGREFITKKLSELKNNLYTKSGNKKWFIPMIKPIEFAKKELPIDPYLLGVLLGDGAISGTNISFSSIDEEIINSVEECIPDELSVKESGGCNYRITQKISQKGTNPTKNILKQQLLGLKLQCNSRGKFIPDVYKLSSVGDRIAMLQGLMDTDGYVDKTGHIAQFTSVSKQLVDDVTFLVQSLGGTTKLSSKIPSYTHNGEKRNGQRAYSLLISLPSEIIPFRLSRKVERFKPKTKYQPYRAIKEVKYIGEKEAQCISVDSRDELYVTDNCILTHNTNMAILWLNWVFATTYLENALIVVPAGLKKQWEEELRDNYIQVPGKTVRLVTYEEVDYAAVEVLIVDEATMVKNDSQRGNAVRDICAVKVLALTGTPIKNMGEDLFYLLQWIYENDKKLFPYADGKEGYNKFVKDFVVVDSQGRKLPMIKNLHLLWRYIAPVILLKTRAQLPGVKFVKKKFLYEEFNFMPEQKEAYDKAKTGNLFADRGRLQDIASNVQSGKMGYIIWEAVAKEIQKEPIIIFVYLQKTAENLHKLIPGSRILNGNMSPTDRARSVEDFKAGKYSVMIAGLEAMNVGYNLDNCCNLYVYEYPYDPAILWQAIARVDRITSQRDLNITFLYVKDSIDELLLRMVEEKYSSNNEVLEALK